MNSHKKTGDKKATKATRDWSDLRKNLIDSVFAGLEDEDCLADRGDANLSTNHNRNGKTSPKPRKSSTERKQLYETKSPKGINHETTNKVVRKDIKRTIAVGLEVKTNKEPQKNILQDSLDECSERTTNLNKDMKKEDKVKDITPKNGNVHNQSERKTKTYLDLEGRKRLRDKYTLKLKNANRNCDLPDMIKDTMKLLDEKDSKVEEENDKTKSKSSNLTEEYETTIKSNKSIKKGPIIKTIRKNDNVYKAVTFGEKKSTTPIQIKIPNDIKKNKLIKIKTRAPSKEFQFTQQKRKSKTFLVKKKEKRLHQRSPSLVKRRSPVTEVAKWVPSCLNDHTKPYYEAWVDTTLAAVTKCSEKEKYLERQKLMENFKAMERFSPEIYEGCRDERYTGRIRVRRK